MRRHAQPPQCPCRRRRLPSYRSFLQPFFAHCHLSVGPAWRVSNRSRHAPMDVDGLSATVLAVRRFGLVADDGLGYHRGNGFGIGSNLGCGSNWAAALSVGCCMTRECPLCPPPQTPRPIGFSAAGCQSRGATSDRNEAQGGIVHARAAVGHGCGLQRLAAGIAADVFLRKGAALSAIRKGKTILFQALFPRSCVSHLNRLLGTDSSKCPKT